MSHECCLGTYYKSGLKAFRCARPRCIHFHSANMYMQKRMQYFELTYYWCTAIVCCGKFWHSLCWFALLSPRLGKPLHCGKYTEYPCRNSDILDSFFTNIWLIYWIKIYVYHLVVWRHFEHFESSARKARLQFTTMWLARGLARWI